MGLMISAQQRAINNDLSQSAYDSLHEDQLQRLSKYNALLSMPIPTIETLGGGSARCMMAEIFLKKEKH